MFVFSNVITPQGLEPLQFPTKFRSHSEEELSRGLRTPAMCKKRGISEQTYYRWRTKRSTIRFSKEVASGNF